MTMRIYFRYSFVFMLALILSACGIVPATEAPTATSAPTQPTAAPQPAGGAIFYLDPDGISVNKINADGSGQELVFSDMSHLLGGPITYMGPVPGSKPQIVMVGA